MKFHKTPVDPQSGEQEAFERNRRETTNHFSKEEKEEKEKAEEKEEEEGKKEGETSGYLRIVT